MATSGESASVVATPGVLRCGPYALDALRVSLVEGLRSYPEDVSAAAERHWEALLREKPHLFDGPVWCIVSHETDDTAEEKTLCMSVQLSSFKYILYTHLTEEGRRLPLSERSGACGLMALSETSDGFLVFGQRSLKLGTMPGYWHCVPAGQVDSADFASVLRKELMEELGIDWSTVRQASLLALMDTGVEQGQKYELTFHIQLSCTAAEVYKLYCSAEDSHEHANLVFVTGPSFVGSTAVDADVSAEAAFPMVDFETFMRGDYMLTDISRRGLSLHREMRSAS